MSENSALERRYRGLLAAYPADHRRLHGEEMVAVLLASARPGQRWPRLADAADLLAGALRIRVRRRPGRVRDSAWLDAMAVVSLVAPLLMLAGSLTTSGPSGFTVRGALTGSLASGLQETGLLEWAVVLAPVIVAVLALLGMRRSVVIAALVTGTIPFTVTLAASEANNPTFGAWLWIDFGMLTAVAAWLSPGPRRGREILRWRGTGAVTVVLLGIAVLAQSWLDNPGAAESLPVLLITVITAMTAGACLTSRTGRRVLVLLVIPGLPALAYVLAVTGIASVVTGSATGWSLTIPSALAALYSPAVLVICLAAGVSRAHQARRKAPPQV